MMQPQPATVEYSVYTYDMLAGPSQKRDHSWKRHLTVIDPVQALSEAETLHNTRRYHRVEVKKKFYDPKSERAVNETMKVYGKTLRNEYRIEMALLFSFICGIFAFFAAYLLTQ